jgi:hypothetical protein
MKLILLIFILLTSLCRSQNIVASIPLGNNRFLHITDVGAHIDGSIVLTCAGSQIAYSVTKNKAKSILIGVLTSLSIGIFGKEIIYDGLMNNGVPSIKDAGKDVWGTGCGAVIMTCKFDINENGLVSRKKHEARQSKFNRNKYILD